GGVMRVRVHLKGDGSAHRWWQAVVHHALPRVVTVINPAVGFVGVQIFLPKHAQTVAVACRLNIPIAACVNVQISNKSIKRAQVSLALEPNDMLWMPVADVKHAGIMQLAPQQVVIPDAGVRLSERGGWVRL